MNSPSLIEIVGNCTTGCKPRQKQTTFGAGAIRNAGTSNTAMSHFRRVSITIWRKFSLSGNAFLRKNFKLFAIISRLMKKSDEGRST